MKEYSVSDFVNCLLAFRIRITLLLGLGYLEPIANFTFCSDSLIKSGPNNWWSPTSSHDNGVLHLLPYKASKGAIFKLATTVVIRELYIRQVVVPTRSII